MRDPARPSWLRTILLIATLTFFSVTSPMPWGRLWLLVPTAVAVSLLASWRFGRWGVLLPVGVFFAALVFAGPESLWVWWIPVASLIGAWMGLREEGGGPEAGARAWMLLPALLFAAGMPWMAQYPELVARVERELRASDAQLLDLGRQIGYQAERLDALRLALEEQAKVRGQILPHVLPSALFVWIAVLVAAGRTLTSRLAGLWAWPALSRARLSNWRLPDGALWLLIASFALLLAQWAAWAPTGWTLLLNTGLGFCVQGIAVVESWMLARGMSPSIIALTLLFVFALAMPVFMLVTAALGLSDVWLDFRRLESVPEQDPQ
jgi:hypothetical protein